MLLEFVSRKLTHLWSALPTAPVGGLANTPSGTAYAPAGTGAPATAVSFANAPSHRPRRLREVLQLFPTSLSLELSTLPLDTAGHLNHAPSPRALATTARFANAPYPLTIPHVAPPGYTYQHQPLQCCFIPAGDSIPIPVRGMPQTQQPSTQAAPLPTRSPRQCFSAVASDRRSRSAISPMGDIFGVQSAADPPTAAAF